MVKKDNFKILSDKEHILQRSGMYVGSTNEELIDGFILGKYESLSYVPAIVKIINEIIDNSIDESIRTNFKYANKITVDISDFEVNISDNGRGIPQDEIIDLDGKKILRPVAAWTKTKAGSNFDDGERVTIGMNGVGSSLTNFFSTKFIGTTTNGKNKVVVTCLNNADSIKVDTFECDEISGTSVNFIPDFEIFNVYNISDEIINVIRDRLTSLQIAFPKISFKFNGKRINERTPLAYFKLYSEQNHFIKTDNTMICIYNSDGWKQNSFINGVQTKNGGSHIDFIFNQLADSLIPLINKKYKIDISKSVIKSNISIVAFLNDFIDPKFDSQTKERLTNTQSQINQHISLDFNKVAKDVLNNDYIIKPIIDALLAKKHAAELLLASKEQKKLVKKKVNGHIKANGNKNTTLFLTEGMSASGFFLNVRDSEKHGLFPLRGKVLNTRNVKPLDILKNNELNSIMSILGLEIGKRCLFPHYDSIAIMVDADHDGLGSIYPLLLNFFSEWKELFDDKRIKFVKTPIIIATCKKETRWFYNLNEYNSANLSGYKIRYIKGLGSLELDEYKEIIHNPIFDVVELDDIEKLEMLFGNDVSKRKSWMLGV